MYDQISMIQTARLREKRYLKLRAKEMSVQAIADADGISKQRVSQILRRAKQRNSAGR